MKSGKTTSAAPNGETFTISADFPLAIEIGPSEADTSLMSSEGYDADHWSTAGIIRRLNEHFEALLAAAAR